MTDKLIILLADMFNKRVDEGKDGFLLIKFSVPVKVLSDLYERLSKIDVAPIETLPVAEKEKYWQIAKRYYSLEDECILGSKASYMISLICNFN